MKTNIMNTPNNVKSWDTLPLTLTPADTAGVLGISRKSVYELVGLKAIPTVRVGKRCRVPRESLRRWLES